MSKAFTKEDDAGFEPLVARAIPQSVFRLTREGARKLGRSDDPLLREALKLAEVIELAGDAPERAVLGVSVEVEDENGLRHVYRLVSAEEQALVGEGCSVESPIGKAILGAEKGEVREVTAPRGTTELEVVKLRGDGEPSEC